MMIEYYEEDIKKWTEKISNIYSNNILFIDGSELVIENLENNSYKSSGNLAKEYSFFLSYIPESKFRIDFHKNIAVFKKRENKNELRQDIIDELMEEYE